MSTRIVYCTTDEVNLMLAERLGRTCGSLVVCTDPSLPAPTDRGSASLHDLDHLSPSPDRTFIADLLAGKPSNTVAVHGYALDEDQAQSLRANGVIVSRSLNPDLFVSIRNAMEAVQKPIPVDGGNAKTGLNDHLLDPAVFCSLVRSVASQAHKVIRDPSGSSEVEWAELRRHLEILRTQLSTLRRSRAQRFDELHRWMNSLERRVTR
jgi:hypothetical protein